MPKSKSSRPRNKPSAPKGRTTPPKQNPASSNDLTLLRQKALRRERDAWIAGVMDTAMDAIISVDEDQNIVLFNAAAERMFGYSAETMIGQPLDRLIPHAYRKLPEPHIPRLGKWGDTTRRMDSTMGVFGLRANGEEFPAEGSLSRSMAGKKPLLTMILRDITQRLHEQTSLENLKDECQFLAQQNSAILNALPAHIILVDSKGTILTVNDPWKRFAEANVFQGKGTGVGVNYLDICRKAHGECEDDAKRVAKGLRAVLAGKESSFQMVYPCHGPQEQRWFRVIITPLSTTERSGAVIMHLNVTDQYLAEEKLQKSEAHRRLAMDAAKVGTWEWDIQHDTIEWSENIDAIFGLSPQSVPRNHQAYLDIIYPADRPRVEQAISRALELQDRYQIEHRLRWPDGTVRWLGVRGQVIRDSPGLLPRMAGTIFDVTEKRRAQQVFLREHHFISTVLDTTAALVVVLDHQWRIVRFNKRCETVTGLPVDQIKGKFFWDLTAVSPEHREEVDLLIESIQTGEFPCQFDTVWLTKTRQPRVIRWRNTVHRNAKGHANFIIATGIDITEQKKSQLDLEESQARYKGIIDTAMDAVICVNADQQILVFNPAAEIMFRCSAEETIGTSLGRFIPDPYRTNHRGHIGNFGRTGSTPRTMGKLGQVFGLRANGEEFPVEASISKVEQGDQTLFTVILRDISERVRIERALRASEERLELALRGAKLGVWDWNVQTGQIRVNKRAAEMLGYTLDEIEPHIRAWSERIHPDDRIAVSQMLQKHLERQTPFYKSEYRLRTKSGQWKWILDSGKVVSRDAQGLPLRATGIHLDITPRKEGELALAKEREFIDAVLETEGALVVVVDPEGRIVRFNRACEDITGISFQEVQGKIFGALGIIPEEEMEGVRKVFQDLLDTLLPNTYENHWMHRNGTKRLIAWTNTVMVGDHGRADYVIATGIDVTDLRKAERESIRLLKQNELILHSAGDGIYGLDKEGKVTFFNQAGERLTGWTSEEVFNQFVHPLFHHSKPDGSPYPWEECPVYFSLKDGMSHQRDTEVLWRKDGTSFPVEYMSTPIYDDTQQISGVVVTFRDIRERKQYEEALRRAEERFQAFMNHSPAVAFLKDPEGRYVYVNRSFEMKLGRSAGECLGKTDRELFPPEIAQMFKETDRQILQTCDVVELEETTLGPRGTLQHWVVFTFPVPGVIGQQLIGGVALDITARKEAEEALKARKKDLLHSQEELRALGRRLISAQEEERRRISRELHDDMNQRLAVLALTIQSAQRGLRESDPEFLMLQRLYDEVSNISDDVRHLAYQLHPSVLDDLGLEIALQSFVQDFARWEGIEADFWAEGVPKSVPSEIAACLYRLGQESLRNVTRHAKASKVAVVLESAEGGLRLSIKDNGKGFDVETVRTGKHGLGLVGMEERVRYVNGTITVHSQKGKGTEVLVWVPLG